MEYDDLLVTSREQWREWLRRNGASTPGVWVVTWKKGGAEPHVPYDDLVDEAIAAGWVDSRPRSMDGRRSARLMTPRKPTSRWSAKNKQRVESLRAAGLMTPAGEAAVQAGIAAGTWNALDEVEQLVEPDDLARALDAVPDARRYWDAFPRSTKRAILEWIGAAKAEATRTNRVERTVSDAAVNIRANQWRQPGR